MSVYITKGPTKSHLTHCFSNYVKNIFGLTDKFNSPYFKIDVTIHASCTRITQGKQSSTVSAWRRSDIIGNCFQSDMEDETIFSTPWFLSVKLGAHAWEAGNEPLGSR